MAGAVDDSTIKYRRG